MRFHSDGPNIPDSLVNRSDAGRVVFLCGAGVSFPSGMPTFIGLTQHVIDFFDPPEDSDVMRAFQPWIDDPTGSNMPLDQVFNLLHQEYGKDAVNALVTDRLQAPSDPKKAGYQHGLIKKISSSPNGIPQIVTTNFDLLFELGDDVGFHEPPAFPDLAFGTSIEGITYLHGRLADAYAKQHPYILSSADFGRAYLSEAWATNFIRNLLERYTVVLVGYQAEDPPIKYLLQGLNHDGQYDRSRLFAFDRGKPEEIEAKWRDRGVTAIAYADHAHLWQTMEAWAERATNPRAWRTSVIEMAQQDPKALLAHQRGQVAHVLRTVPGAKLFTEAQPPAHPEWVCVMDANIRSAKEARGYGDDAEAFEPRHAYGLDDDQQDITEDERRRGVTNDHLLTWRHDDENPPVGHRVGGRQAEGYETTPPRIWHLITWIGKNVRSPVLAWWAIRQNGLHPRLLHHIEWQIAQLPDLHTQARHTWNLVLEHHKDPRNRQWNGDWFDLKKRISGEGWTASVLRDFCRICNPRVEIKPPYRLDGSRPPRKDWDELSLGDVGQFEVKFLERHNEDLSVPDEVLPQVFGVLQHGMIAASGMLADIGTVYFRTPSCYPKREVDGDERDSDVGEVMTLFIKLFDRLSDQYPDIALGHVLTWPEDDKFFFRKLKLYALSKPAIFTPDDVAKRILALTQDFFWDTGVSRELLFLLVDRWATFTDDQRTDLGERILTGPDKAAYWSDDEYPGNRDEFAARYARYLELQGCALTEGQSARLVEITSDIERWSDGWATSTVTERGSRVGWVGTDETPDAVMDLPVSEVVTRAKEGLKRDFGTFTEKRPFTGLVKAKPSKALSALSFAAKQNDYPEGLWSALINDMPEDISPRLRRVFLRRLALLPHKVVQELRHTLGRWIEKNLVGILAFDDDLGWLVFDHFVDGIVNGGPEAAESGRGEMRQGGEIIQKSRRTYGHAINGPLGMCVDALFHAVPGEKQEAGSLIPQHIKTRVERLFAAPGEGSDHAVSITMSKLNWLMHVDPTWTEERLVPMLAFGHPAAEPAWNGFLHSQRVPWSPLAILIKSLLLELPPWIDQQKWDRELSKVAAQWLGYMGIFNRDQPDGLTKKEMRNVLRRMSDDTRNRFIFWLGQVGKGNVDGWNKLVVPFMNEVWPRERVYRTASSTNSWIGLLDDTGQSFPAVYASVKQFLVSVETDQHPFYRFTRELDEGTPLTAQFPEATLDLVNAVTPGVLSRPQYELPKLLAIVAETAPELMADHRYLRLIDLVERS